MNLNNAEGSQNPSWERDLALTQGYINKNSLEQALVQLGPWTGERAEVSTRANALTLQGDILLRLAEYDKAYQSFDTAIRALWFGGAPRDDQMLELTAKAMVWARMGQSYMTLFLPEAAESLILDKNNLVTDRKIGEILPQLAVSFGETGLPLSLYKFGNSCRTKYSELVDNSPLHLGATYMFDGHSATHRHRFLEAEDFYYRALSNFSEVAGAEAYQGYALLMFQRICAMRNDHEGIAFHGREAIQAVSNHSTLSLPIRELAIAVCSRRGIVLGD